MPRSFPLFCVDPLSPLPFVPDLRRRRRFLFFSFPFFPKIRREGRSPLFTLPFFSWLLQYRSTKVSFFPFSSSDLERLPFFSLFPAIIFFPPWEPRRLLRALSFFLFPLGKGKASPLSSCLRPYSSRFSLPPCAKAEKTVPFPLLEFFFSFPAAPAA